MTYLWRSASRIKEVHLVERGQRFSVCCKRPIGKWYADNGEPKCEKCIAYIKNSKNQEIKAYLPEGESHENGKSNQDKC